MKRFLSLLFFFSLILHAQSGCVLEQSGKIDLLWQAYKTPDKIGIKGTFGSVTYTPTHRQGKNFKELFVGSTIRIDTLTPDTGNTLRDEKLVNFFFKQLKEPYIEGKILSITSDPHIKGKPRTGKMVIALTLNGRTKQTTLDYHYFKGSFKAQGNIDLVAFAAGKALATINKACFDLHKGKTWSDVSIGFITTIKATLCHVDTHKR
jgi:hypothetical protein